MPSAATYEDYVDAIRADLTWLGLRLGRRGAAIRAARPLRAAFTALRAAGRIYPCCRSAQEKRGQAQDRSGSRPPADLRPGSAQADDAERAAKEAEGTLAHWRFMLDHAEPILWDIRGPQKFDPAQLSIQ